MAADVFEFTPPKTPTTIYTVTVRRGGNKDINTHVYAANATKAINKVVTRGLPDGTLGVSAMMIVDTKDVIE